MTLADDHLLVGAYALGALDPSEAEAFEAHLARCGACREELAALTRTAALLATAVATPVDDPLLDRVMQQVRVTAQEPAPGVGINGRAVSFGEAVGGRPSEPPVRLTAAGGHEPRSKAGPVARWVLSAAAVIVLALLAGTMVSRLAGERARENEMAAIVDDPAGQHYRMAGDDGSEVGVHLDPATGKAVVDTKAVPVLDPGRTYELWYLSGATPHRAATFSPDESGTARVLFTSPVPDPEALAVTIEPAGGRDEPTMPLVYQAAA